ncbi:MAG: GSU2403 family nucleotidyltransferase fold protein [Nitratireductor sp.]
MIAHSAYIDLLRLLKDEEAGEIRGKPMRLQRGNRQYWYDNFRVGNQTIKRYLGEDSEELRKQISAANANQESEKKRRERRSYLIRLLRTEGIKPIERNFGSLLSALADAGAFRLGGTLVGTLAFRLYEGELGVRMPMEEIAQTDDVDIASFERLSIALADIEQINANQVLRNFDFDPLPALDHNASWRWKQADTQTLVEFLTPSFDAEEGIRPLPALGVNAQALHFLNFLIAEPIKAAVPYRSGVLVQIPTPERFAVHKLIVADKFQSGRKRGPDALKSVKDRRQAAFLIEVLAEDRPDELREAWEDARERGPKWRERLDRSLARMPETAKLLATL